MKDRTEIGGPDGAFRTTQWTQLLDARTLDEGRRRDALGAVMARYWKPVYVYLRRKGRSNEAAKDLTQGFFEQVVLGRELVQQADQAKGRFRTFLMTALDRYVTSVHRAETARKRAPAGGMVHLDGVEAPERLEPSHHATAEEAFAYSWASELLDEVLEAVAADCRRAGQQTHWQVFFATVVQPIQTGEPAPTMADLCRQFGIRSEAKASNMNVTVKRRFKAVLRARVRPHVEADDQVDQEIRELMAILASKPGAGS